MANGKKYKSRADMISKFSQKQFAKNYPSQFEKFLKSKKLKKQQDKDFLSEVKENYGIKGYIASILEDRKFQRDCDKEFRKYLRIKLPKKNGALDTLQIFEHETETETRILDGDGLIVEHIHKPGLIKNPNSKIQPPASSITYEGFDYYLGKQQPNEVLYAKVTACYYKGLALKDGIIYYTGFVRNSNGKYEPINLVTKESENREMHFGKLADSFESQIDYIKYKAREYEELEMGN